MRFLAALALAAVILGGVGFSQHMLTQRVRFDVTREAHGHGEAQPESGKGWGYRVELTSTFDAAADPFAVRVDAADDVPRLLVRHAGQELLRLSQDWHRGQMVAIPSVALEGRHAELFVQASPSAAEAAQSCGVRVRVIREDGALCDDQTIWTEGGGAVLAQAVRVSLDPVLERLDRGLGEGPP